MRTWIVPLFTKHWLVVSLCLNLFSWCAGTTPSPISVSCDRQLLLKDRYVLFDGEVQLKIGDRLSIRAPRLLLDRQSEQVFGSSDINLSYTMNQSSRSRVPESAFDEQGVLNATASQLVASWRDETASLTQATVTGCDDPSPHWVLRADQVTIGADWIRTRGLSGRIAGVPLFYVPFFALPISPSLAGSSLVPQLSYDAMQGLGVRHHLEYHPSRHTTAQLDLNWRSRRGAVWRGSFLTEERALQSGTLSAWYGYDRTAGLNRFTGEPELEHHYWLRGRGRYHVGGADGPLLLSRLEYGSDKRLTERFFAAPSSRDDCDVSAVATRWADDSQLLDMQVRHVLLRRNEFAPTLKTRGITRGSEQYEVQRVYYVPQVRWHHTLTHDDLPVTANVELGGDWTIVRNAQHDIIYDPVHNDYAKESGGRHMGRLWLEGHATTWATTDWGHAQLSVAPYLQARACGYTVPATVAGGAAGVSFAGRFDSSAWRLGSCELVSTASLDHCDGKPALAPYYLDRHDHVTHATTIAAAQSVAGNGWRVTVRQPFAVGHEAEVLPLETELRATHSLLDLCSHHEYDWRLRRFAKHQLSATLSLPALSCSVGLDHYDPLSARQAERFFDGGTFVSSGVKWYPSQHWYCWYTSRWAYEHADKIMRGLHHDIGIAYKGHCWELAAGYREHRYMQYGRQRKQCSYFLKVRLCPVGTIGTAFKRWVYE